MRVMVGLWAPFEVLLLLMGRAGVVLEEEVVVVVVVRERWVGFWHGRRIRGVQDGPR